MNNSNRIFKCVSLNGTNIKRLSDYFKIGESYKEADKDMLNHKIEEDNMLLLFINYKTKMNNFLGQEVEIQPSFYVEESDFIEETIQMCSN